MLRKMVCAGFLMAVTVGLAVADEFRAVITKAEDGKVTFKKMIGKFEKGVKPEFGEEQTLPTAANVKVVSAKFNKDTMKLEAGEPLEGGLKAIGGGGEKRGTFGVIVTDASNKNITEIRVLQGFGKKKKKDQ